MKRIMLDGKNISLDKGTGVATYTRNLSHSISELGHKVEIIYGKRVSADGSELLREIQFYDDVLPNGGAIKSLINGVKDVLLSSLGHRANLINISEVVVKKNSTEELVCDAAYNSSGLYGRSHNIYKYTEKIQRVVIKNKPDVMHWTYPLPLKVFGVPNLYTLHDLVPLRLPYTTLDDKKKYLKLALDLAKTADHIVTVFEASKRDIIKYLNIEERRITNTYQAVRIPEVLVNKDLSLVQKELNVILGLLYKEYFLFWGSIEPKKT